MIANILSNKNLNPIVTELFIRGRKVNISLVFTTQSYFAVPKIIRLNFTHYFIMKILNKPELQQIALSYSSGCEFRYFINLYKNCTAKPYYFLVIDAIRITSRKKHIFFFQIFWKDGLSKNCTGIWSFLYYQERLYFFFPENMILFFRRKM